MRRHRIVLYNPCAPFFTMPLGLVAIGSALDRSRFDVTIVDGRLEADPVERVLALTDGALCLGVGVLTGTPIADALAITEAVRAQRPQCRIADGSALRQRGGLTLLSYPSPDHFAAGAACLAPWSTLGPSSS